MTASPEAVATAIAAAEAASDKLATDIVAGLRILRGVGGEETFGANYARQSQKVRRLGVRVGSWQGVVEAISVLVSGGLLVVVVYLGTHELAASYVGLDPVQFAVQVGSGAIL